MIYCRGCHLLETIFCQIRHWLKTLNTPRKLHPKLRSKLRRLRKLVLKLTKPENFTDLQQPGIFLIQSFCFIDQNSDQNSEITVMPEGGGASTKEWAESVPLPLVGIGLTDLPNIGGQWASCPLSPPPLPQFPQRLFFMIKFVEFKFGLIFFEEELLRG